MDEIKVVPYIPDEDYDNPAMARLAHGGSPPAGQKQRSGYQ